MELLSAIIRLTVISFAIVGFVTLIQVVFNTALIIIDKKEEKEKKFTSMKNIVTVILIIVISFFSVSTILTETEKKNITFPYIINTIYGKEIIKNNNKIAEESTKLLQPEQNKNEGVD